MLTWQTSGGRPRRRRRRVGDALVRAFLPGRRDVVIVQRLLEWAGAVQEPGEGRNAR
jgi:hypothetical protein